MVEFLTAIDEHFAAELLEMMHDLFAHEPAPRPTAEHFKRTMQRLLADPPRGRIVLFLEAGTVVGYALLIPYWSNEFGGTLLFIDELYVKPDARGRGIGRQFLQCVLRERPFDANACALEVSPGNIPARRLYEAVGFVPRTHTMLTLKLPE